MRLPDNARTGMAKMVEGHGRGARDAQSREWSAVADCAAYRPAFAHCQAALPPLERARALGGFYSRDRALPGRDSTDTNHVRCELESDGVMQKVFAPPGYAAIHRRRRK